MFDKASEILDVIRDRLRSPLLGSYFIALCIANWRVFIALFWFGDAELNLSGSCTHVEYIEQVTNWRSLFAIPMIVSLIYTFLWPFIRNKIDEFTTKRNVEGQQLQRPILGQAVFTAEQYLLKREELDIKQKELEETLAAAKEVEREKMEQTELIQKLNDKISNLERKYDSSALNGVWHRQETGEGKEGERITKIKIADAYYNRYNMFGKPDGSNRIETFEAEYNRQVAFFKFRIFDGSSATEGGKLIPLYIDVELYESPDRNTLRGHEIHLNNETRKRVEILMQRVHE